MARWPLLALGAVGLFGWPALAIPVGPLQRPSVAVVGRQVTVTWTTPLADSTTEVVWDSVSHVNGTPGDYPNSSGNYNGLTVTGPLVRRHSRTFSLPPGTYYLRAVSRADTIDVPGTSEEVQVEVSLRTDLPALYGPNSRMVVPNGPVHTVASQGATLYFGGSFSAVGPLLGRGFGLSAEGSGALATSDQPIVDGPVTAVISDGQGGFYIGGDFSMVGAVARKNIAHILGDFGVDAEFKVQTNGPVNALLLLDGALYLGGRFTTVSADEAPPVARLNAAAVNDTGSLRAWDPQVGGEVRALAAWGATVFIGGSFATASGLSCHGLIAVDSASGAPAHVAGSTFVPSIPNRMVTALAVSAGTIPARLFVGFSQRSPSPLPLAFFDLSTAEPTYSVGTWEGTGEVSSILLATSLVYVGGNFTVGTSQGEVRRYAAGLNQQLTVMLAWDPQPSAAVSALAFAPGPAGHILLGGEFTVVGGQASPHLALVDTSLGEPVTGWSPQPNGPVRALAPTTNSGGPPAVWLGGEFTGLSPFDTPRPGAAAVDVTSGTVLPWNPGLRGPSAGGPPMVRAIVVTPAGVVLGGAFSKLGATNLIRLDGATAAALPLGAYPNATVEALAFVPPTLLAGGEFSSVGGNSRSFVAAFDAQFLLSGWRPTLVGPVRAIAPGVGQVYVGGDRIWNSGGTFENAAAFDAVSANPRAWVTRANGPVGSLAVRGEVVYLGGEFDSAGGVPRPFAAAVSAQDGALAPWNPRPNGPVAAVTPTSQGVLLAGSFTGVGSGTGQDGTALVDFDVGTVAGWSPALRGGRVFAHSTTCPAGAQAWGGSFSAAADLNLNQKSAVASPYLAVFRTSDCLGAPLVETRSATAVTASSAELNAHAAPAQDAGVLLWFRYGATSPGNTCPEGWGVRAPSDGGFLVRAQQLVAMPIGQLAPSSTYWFCALGTVHSTAPVVQGGVLSFSTLIGVDGGPGDGGGPDGGGFDASIPDASVDDGGLDGSVPDGSIDGGPGFDGSVPDASVDGGQKADSGTDGGPESDGGSDAGCAVCITSRPPLLASCGVPWRYAATSTSAGTAWRVSLAPEGLTASPAGLLEWTPTAAQRGPQQVVLIATGPGRTSDSQAFEVSVDCPERLDYRPTCGCSSSGSALALLALAALRVARRRRSPSL